MLPTYDPKLVILTLGEIFVSGYADGTMIDAVRDGDSFTKVKGADGEVARVRNRDRSGSVTVTLMQSSMTNDAFSALLAADELFGTGVRPLMLQEVGGKTLIVSDRAWLRKPANAGYANTMGDRQWVIDCASLEPFVGGNPGV